MESIKLAREAYHKGVIVVNCCTNAEQLAVADKYVGNYLLNCVKPSSGGPYEKFINDYYNALTGLIKERYKLLEINI
jgi:hypothetical protein